MKNRVLTFIDYLKIPVSTFEKNCGLGNGCVKSLGYNSRKDTIDKIISRYPELNMVWLRTGIGNMLNTPTPSISATNNGTINGDMNTGINNASPSSSVESHETHEDDLIPVIPMEAYDNPGVDVYEYVNDPNTYTHLLPAIRQLPEYEMYYTVQGDEMAPYFLTGDKLAINPYKIGDERKLIGGRVYVVDTNTNGMMLRMLYINKEGGFKAVAHNPRYDDVYIDDADVIRIYRVLGLLRTSI